MTAPPYQTSPDIPVLAAVIHRADRWLLCRRPAHKRHGGFWEFPGGKLEPGESLEDAARRELLEELDVAVVSVGDVLYSMRDADSAFVIHFTHVAIAGEPQPREHDEIRWVTPADAILLPLAPADRGYVLHTLGP